MPTRLVGPTSPIDPLTMSRSPFAQPAPWVRRLTARSDIALALLVTAIVALIVLPVPPFMLDTLIALSIASGVGLLMLSMYVHSPLALSTFPALLLFTTLFRLALSIGSTKQILLHAHAGEIIESFGRLVIGGNVVVGLVVFLVIAVVQFLVIAKGSERIAEVGARFTLDAMPGKQMSIDADLRAGLIDKEEARRRRDSLGQESQMHGAMDGAMKFVKNDAIATILIALINIVAGISIGVGMKGMGFAEAIGRYTILTVGDGMVAQIPSLFVSIAAGLLITRVAGRGTGNNLGVQITEQITAQPAALVATGALLIAFAWVPGFPKLQFIGLALLVGGAGCLVLRDRRRSVSIDDAQLASAQREGSAVRHALVDPGDSLIAHPLLLRLPLELRGRIDPALMDAALAVKRQALQRELGVPFPGLRLRFEAEMPAGHCAIDVQEVSAPATAMPPEAAADLPAWLAVQIAATIRHRADAFIGMQEVQSLIGRVEAQLPDLVSELHRTVPLQRVADVLRRLVQEGVSLRYLREIFESLITWGAKEKDVVMLTEYVRVDLGRLLSYRHLDAQGRLHAWVLDADTEQAFRQCIQQGVGGSFLALPPEVASRVMASAQAAMASAGDEPSVLLASMDVRRYVKKFFSGRFPDLVVLSFQELPPEAEVFARARVGMTPALEAA
jgi:type III secretion protein V